MLKSVKTNSKTFGTSMFIIDNQWKKKIIFKLQFAMNWFANCFNFKIHTIVHICTSNINPTQNNMILNNRMTSILNHSKSFHNIVHQG